MPSSQETKEQEAFEDEWREYPIGSGYFITKDGKVFSTKRKEIHKMRSTLNNSGYYSIQFRIYGGFKCYLIHRLVASAYLGEPLRGQQVNHKDKDPRNNDVSNLEWVTPEYNVRYSSLKYSEETAKEMRRLVKSVSYKKVASLYNLTEKIVHGIVGRDNKRRLAKEWKDRNPEKVRIMREKSREKLKSKLKNNRQDI